MRSELKGLQRNLGITTVYVTHDQVEAMSLGDRIAVLRDGRIEQIGTPEELYGAPNNLFVATFIGSPCMNLIKTEFLEKNGRFFVLIGDKRFNLPEDRSKKLRELKSKECILGIRPEHICTNINPNRGGQPVSAKLHSIEPMGKEKLLHVSIDRHRFSVLTADTDKKEGEIIDIGFDLKKAHIFKA